MEKRYIVTVDAYIYASSEEEAKQKAFEMVDVVKKIDDNNASVVSLTASSFGQIRKNEEINILKDERWR